MNEIAMWYLVFNLILLENLSNNFYQMSINFNLSNFSHIWLKVDADVLWNVYDTYGKDDFIRMCNVSLLFLLIVLMQKAVGIHL